MWMIFAVLSAVFAALTSILAKIGIEGVNSNLATAIRTIVVVIMAWGMVFLTHAQNGLAEISNGANEAQKEEERLKYMEKLMAESGCTTTIGSSVAKSWRVYGYN